MTRCSTWRLRWGVSAASSRGGSGRRVPIMPARSFALKPAEAAAPMSVITTVAKGSMLPGSPSLCRESGGGYTVVAKTASHGAAVHAGSEEQALVAVGHDLHRHLRLRVHWAIDWAVG